MFLQIPVGIAEYGNMMVVTCIDEIYGLLFPFGVKHKAALVVTFVMEGYSIAYSFYGHTFYGNSFFLVKPYWVFFKV